MAFGKNYAEIVGHLGGDVIVSVAFRYVRDLSRIKVNGTEYAQGTMLMPGETGYPRTEISLVGADGSTLTPVLPPQAQQAIAPSGEGERPVHRPEARTASVAQRGDEVAVAVHGGAERPGAHPVPGAPDLDRPQKPGIEDAAGI